MRQGLSTLVAALVLTLVPSLPSAPSAEAAPGEVVSVVVEGTGFGHGRGLSQWGAYGWAVDQNRSWQWILDHYFGGTVLADANTAQARIRVRLLGLDGATTVGVVAGSGSVTAGGFTRRSLYVREVSDNRFQLYGSNAAACPGSSTLAVPNGPVARGSGDSAAVRQIQTFLNAFRIAGDATLAVDGLFGPLTEGRLRDWQGDQGLPVDGVWHTSEATRARQLIAAGSGGSWSLLTTVTGPVTFTSPNGDDSAASPSSVLGVCDAGGRVTHYRGRIEVRHESFGNRIVNDVKTEDYLRGVLPKEISASWADAGGGRGANAVRAQAVAARSYGLAQARYSYASTCDSMSCQVYAGAATRATASSSPVAVEDRRTDAAIVATAGKVRRFPNGTIASTEFSASNGPRTAGGVFPPVDDAPGDGTSRNPNHRWTRVLDAEALASRYGLGAITAATMVEAASSTYRQFDGIWYNDIVLTGTNGRSFRQQAWDFRRTHNLPSPGFTVRVVTSGTPSAPPSNRLAPPRRLEVPVVGETVRFADGSSGTVPATASAVAINAVAVDPSSNGFLSVWPCGVDRPLASSLNYRAGTVVSNGLIAPIGAGGTVCLHSHASTDVVLDVTGWFEPSAGGGFTAITPFRVGDSRDGTGMPLRRLSPGEPVRLQIRGLAVRRPDGTAATVPVDAEAAAVNVAAVEPAANGFLTVYPCGDEPPSSTLNYVAGEVRANKALTRLDGGGGLCVVSHRATDVVVDVTGWFTGGSGLATTTFVSSEPARWVDTRDGTGAPARRLTSAAPLEIRVVGRTLTVDGRSEAVPATARAVAINVAAVGPTRNGFATTWPCGQPRPTASSMNFRAGRTTANNTIVPVGANGSICLYVNNDTDVVVDVTGWINDTGGFVGVVPGRFVDTRERIGPAPR